MHNFFSYISSNIIEYLSDLRMDLEDNLMNYLDNQYEEAGKLVAEEENQISLTSHSHLLNDEVAIILQQVLEEHPLSFELQDFQKLALHSIGSMNNVILIREGFKIFNFARMILYTWNGDRMVLFPLTSIREGFNKKNISYGSFHTVQ